MNVVSFRIYRLFLFLTEVCFCTTGDLFCCETQNGKANREEGLAS